MIAIAERTLRYGIVGLAVSIAYSLAIVVATRWLPTHNPVWASGFAFAALLPVAYLGHRYIAFSDAAHDPFQPVRFAVSAMSSFLVIIGGMYAVTEIFGRSYLLGIALNWALIPAINFLVYLFWVFRVAGADATGRTGRFSPRSLDGKAPLPLPSPPDRGERVLLSRAERS